MPPDPVDLITAADEQVAKVRTRAQDYSFNELVSMYDDKELVVNPDYQRLFRWSEAKQSRFIESLLLELPLPPIFVIEVEDGKYELIDGLQRISSYLHFRGKLDAPHREIKPGDFLVLEDCDIVAALNGQTYEKLPRALEIKLKRHSVRVEVIRKESDPRLRYHMFKRLNTGGTLLSEQEIRNCTIRLLDNTLNQFIIDRSQDEDYVECVSTVSDEQTEKKFDQELVLRFFAFKNWRDKYVHEVSTFLTEYMEAVAEPARSGIGFDYEANKQVFQKTFAVLRAAMGEKAFSHIDRRGRMQPFSVYHFESFTLGLQPHLGRLDPADPDQMKRLQDCCWGIKKDEGFRSITTGGGKNSRGPMNDRIEFVSKRVGEAV